MAYKNILVHLNDSTNIDKLLNSATALAQYDEAHLTGLFVLPPILVPAMPEMAFSDDVWEVYRQEGRKQAEHIKEVFERATRNSAFSAEWRFIDAGTAALATVVAEQARSFDLTILGQGQAGAPSSVMDTPQRVVMDSGRPILLIPAAGRITSIGSNVLIAWNGQKEAARAAFDALPILKRAGTVHILTIDSPSEAKLGRVPGADLAAALARHGVNCETAQFVADDLPVSHALLNYASDHGIDLLVMGCYGHTRLRELVFGGASRTIFSQATTAVLMSH